MEQAPSTSEYADLNIPTGAEFPHAETGYGLPDPVDTEVAPPVIEFPAIEDGTETVAEDGPVDRYANRPVGGGYYKGTDRPVSGGYYKGTDRPGRTPAEEPSVDEVAPPAQIPIVAYDAGLRVDMPKARIETTLNPETTRGRLGELAALAVAHQVEVELTGAYSRTGNKHTYTVDEAGKKHVISRQKYGEKSQALEDAKPIERPDAGELLKLSNSDLAALTGMSEQELFKGGMAVKIEAVDRFLGTPVKDKAETPRYKSDSLSKATDYLAEGLAEGDREKTATGLKGAERNLGRLRSRGELTDAEYNELAGMLGDVERVKTAAAKRDLAEAIYRRMERLTRHKAGEDDPGARPSEEILVNEHGQAVLDRLAREQAGSDVAVETVLPAASVEANDDTSGVLDRSMEERRRHRWRRNARKNNTSRMAA